MGRDGCHGHVMENKNMNLTDYKVKRIISSHGDLQLGEPADVIDECGFYRIASTTIIDKFKINGIEKKDDRLTVRTKDKDVVLIVCEKEKRIYR